MFIFNLITTFQFDKIAEVYKTLQSENNTVFESALHTNKTEEQKPLMVEKMEFYKDISRNQHNQELANLMMHYFDSNSKVFSRKVAENSLAFFALKE